MTDVHGGNIYAVARELNRHPDEILDFSASINPLGPSPTVWKAIAAARKLATHYPDPFCLELRQALGQRWGIDPEQIVVGNGSMELIDVVPRALTLKRLLVVHPTFSEYGRAMARAGGSVVTVHAKRAQDYAIPIDRLVQLLDSNEGEALSLDGLVLCNPNSPTGRTCSVDDVSHLATLAARRKLWLVLDEAFADYCPERSVLPQAASWPRVIVLRSMTKFYALPGLRVGYAVVSRSVVRRLRTQLPPWSVNAIGQVAALAALGDRAHAEKSLCFMNRARARFASLLSALPGCRVIEPSANYVFVELPQGWQARMVAARLKRQGLLIRDCSSVPGASARAIRVAVRRPLENNRLIKALSTLLGDRNG
ncbi:MAG: threonine-phosphate decarboxylase CobD [Nitrospira sp.]|nr:threonine-phosphate decarboxylase CobD [Nitrospira sp.]